MAEKAKKTRKATTAKKAVKSTKRKTQKKSDAAAKPLTDKQRRFVKAKLEGKNSYQAAKEAGYTERVAVTANRVVSSKPNVQAALERIFAERGITDEALADKLQENLEATKTITASNEGQITDSMQVPDFAQRLKAVEFSWSMMGRAPSVKHDVTLRLEDVLSAAWREPPIEIDIEPVGSSS